MRNERGEESQPGPEDPTLVRVDSDKPNGEAPGAEAGKTLESDLPRTLEALDETTAPVPVQALPPSPLPPASPAPVPEPGPAMVDTGVEKGQLYPLRAGPHVSSGPIRNDLMSYQNFVPPAPPADRYPAAVVPPAAAPVRRTPLTHVPWQVSDSWGATTLNITANTAAGASYLFWWISGVLVYFSERNNRFVRFHALQSIILTGALTVVGVFAALFATIMHDLTLATRQGIFFHIGLGSAILLALIMMFTWLLTMVAAWTGNYLRLPVIGRYAERYSAPPSNPTRHPLL